MPRRRSPAPLLVLAVALPLGLVPVRHAAAYGPEIEALATEIASEMAGSGLGAVAVYDFYDLGGDTSELGRYLAEEMSAALVDAIDEVEADHPRVIDRLRLTPILDEMQFQSTGLPPAKELREVGRIAGVDALVTGRITPFVDTFQLTVKVLDVTSAEELLSHRAALPRTPSLSELEKRSLTVVVSPGDCGDVAIDLEGAALGTVQLAGVEVALRGCARVEETVHCLLGVTAREEDRSIKILGGTRMVLPDGAQIPVRRMTVGDSSATGEASQAGHRLVRGVPTAGTVSFENVPRRATSIRRLELDLWGDDVRFEDVPIETP